MHKTYKNLNKSRLPLNQKNLQSSLFLIVSTNDMINNLFFYLYLCTILQNIITNSKMISAPSIDQFMLRKQRHRKMIQTQSYPQSSSTKFIVPCFQRSFGFRTNEYAKNTELLQDLIDKPIFQSFVRKANHIIDKQLIEKAKNQNSAFFSKTSLYLKLSIIVGILTFTILSLIVYMDFSPDIQDKILKTGIVLIVFSVGIGVISPFYLYLRQYTQYDYEAIIKKQLDQLAEQQNLKNKTQGRQYLEWSFQKSFFWIQLDINHQLFKDRKLKYNTKFSPNQIPPLIQ